MNEYKEKIIDGQAMAQKQMQILKQRVETLQRSNFYELTPQQSSPGTITSLFSATFWLGRGRTQRSMSKGKSRHAMLLELSTQASMSAKSQALRMMTILTRSGFITSSEVWNKIRKSVVFSCKCLYLPILTKTLFLIRSPLRKMQMDCTP